MQDKEEQEQEKITMTCPPAPLPAAYLQGPPPSAEQLRRMAREMNRRCREMVDEWLAGPPPLYMQAGDSFDGAGVEEERERILALIDDRIRGYRKYKPNAAWEDVVAELEQFKTIITDGE